jgi:hypothetical protein
MKAINPNSLNYLRGEMRFFLIIILLCFSSLVQSQDINGVWKGRLVMAPSGCFPIYNLEFDLIEKQGIITGTALHFSDSLNYIKKNIRGTYLKDSNRIKLQEIAISSFRIREDCVPCIKTYTLSYHKGTGTLVTDEQIRGVWETPGGKAADGKTSCDPGTLVLNRQSKASFPKEDTRPKALQEKSNVLVQEIKVDSGIVNIEFYDNGQIDGDTISVYVNNRSVVYKQLLRTQPVTMTLQVDSKRAVQDVVMVGENLGTIPPNTALMIVTANNKRFQLYLTADEKKNAMVRFIYEKSSVSK